MNRLKKILDAEIAQRELALKHKPLNSSEIEAELKELREGLVKLFAIGDVIGCFSIGSMLVIVDDTNGHGFKIGETVTIIGGEQKSWLCENEKGESWYLDEIDARALK